MLLSFFVYIKAVACNMPGYMMNNKLRLFTQSVTRLIGNPIQKPSKKKRGDGHSPPPPRTSSGNVLCLCLLLH